MEPSAWQKPEKKGPANPVRDLIRRRPQLLFDMAGSALKEMLDTPKVALRRRRMRQGGQRAIGYIGWTGHKNLGDEAVFQAIGESLAINAPLIPFIAAEGEALLNRFGAGGSDCFRAALLGGGTLINPFFLPAGRLVQKFGIPMYTVGTGVGSPSVFTPDHFSVSSWKAVLQDCELLSVRGPLSYELLQNAGLTHTEVIGDPALGLTPDQPPAFGVRQRLIINLMIYESRQVPDSSEDAMFHSVAKIANDFADKGGELIGVALGDGDRGALEMFMRDHRVGRLQIEDHRTSTQNLFRTLSGSIGLIGMRLHSAVLASCMGVPSILFAYRQKCRDFMNSMDLGDFAIEISRDRGPRQIAECFGQLQSRPDLGPAIYEKAIFWKNKQRMFYAKLAKSIAGLPRP